MISAFYLDSGLRSASDLKSLEGVKAKPLWVDVSDISKEEAEALQNVFSLHPLTVEDLLNHRGRVKVEEFSEYLVCVFYSSASAKNIEMEEIDFVLGPNFVLSNHWKSVESFENLKKNPEKIGELLKKGPDFMLHALLDAEIENFYPVLENVSDRIEALEDRVVKGPKTSYLMEILKLKRQIAGIKKLGFQHREKVSFLAKNEYKLISKKAAPYFRDAYDQSIRVSDMIETQREAIGNAFDVYMSALANNTNEVMKILSIIATIALPLTVISSIYGTNFRALPGAENPLGFWLMLTLMLAVSFLMLYYFRRKGWI